VGVQKRIKLQHQFFSRWKCLDLRPISSWSLGDKNCLVFVKLHITLVVCASLSRWTFLRAGFVL